MRPFYSGRQDRLGRMEKNKKVLTEALTNLGVELKFPLLLPTLDIVSQTLSP